MIMILVWVAIQIITESFPISSSGHTFLFERLIRCFVPASEHSGFPFATMACKRAVNAVLHVPTIIIIACYFFNQWFFMLKHLFRIRKIVFKLALFIMIADIITSFAYFVLHLQDVQMHVAFGFLITTAVLLWVSRASCELRPFSFKTAFIMGLAQSIALLPGFSRMALTYAAARLMGTRTDRALQLSFLIQVPLLLGASFLSCITMDFSCIRENILNLPMVLGILSATGISWFGFQKTMALAHNNAWHYFAFYTGCVALLSVVLYTC